MPAVPRAHRYAPGLRPSGRRPADGRKAVTALSERAASRLPEAVRDAPFAESENERYPPYAFCQRTAARCRLLVQNRSSVSDSQVGEGVGPVTPCPDHSAMEVLLSPETRRPGSIPSKEESAGCAPASGRRKGSSWLMRISVSHCSYRWGGPAPVADEQPVYLGQRERVDDVRSVALAQLRPQGAGAGQGTGDLALALLPLPGQLGEQRGSVRIGARCAEEDPVKGLGPRHDAADDPARPDSWFLGSGFASNARTWGRSCIVTAWSSPAIKTWSSALRIPSFEENSRYTVAGGTSERSLMASIVVAA